MWQTSLHTEAAPVVHSFSNHVCGPCYTGVWASWAYNLVVVVWSHLDRVPKLHNGMAELLCSRRVRFQSVFTLSVQTQLGFRKESHAVLSGCLMPTIRNTAGQYSEYVVLPGT